MKFLPFFLLLLFFLALAGCASPSGPPPLSMDGPTAVANVKAFVPLGTPADQAQQLLTQHKFRCKLAPSGDYLYASLSWPPGDLLQTTWSFTLKLTDNKVSAINVVITSLGNAGNYQQPLPGGGLSPNINNPS